MLWKQESFSVPAGFLPPCCLTGGEKGYDLRELVEGSTVSFSTQESPVSALKRGLLVAVFVGQLVASSLIGWTQTSQSLQSRIPKPDPKKYRAVQDAKDWKNPYLIVRRDGIEIVGTTAVGQTIPVDSVPGVLKGLPDSAWPYGLVVAVQDIGLVSQGDPPRIEANRKRLLTILQKLNVAVDLWPSA